MKNMLILTLIGATILSCSSDDDNQGDISHQIIGDWKLVETKFYDIFYGEEVSIDHRHKNIIYSFQANGTLIVSGASGENDGRPSGEYPYFFGYDHLGSSSDPSIVKIDGLEWRIYALTNGTMILGRSYVDGSDLVFERVKERE